jgi:hypothetical protein
MENEIHSELFRVLDSIEIDKLNNGDKEELLKIFNHTENYAIRNHIAMIFADTRYQEAVPSIIKKIGDKTLLNKTRTLVYALKFLDAKKYLIDLIKIIYEQEYEARLMAYGGIEHLLPLVSIRVGNQALKILDDYKEKLKKAGAGNEVNGKLHFVESTIELLES